MKVTDFENAKTKVKEHAHVCVDVTTQCQAKEGQVLDIKGSDDNGTPTSVKYTAAGEACMLPRLGRSPVATLFAGEFCSNSEECGNGFTCRPTLISGRRFATACVPEESCFEKPDVTLTLTNAAYKFTAPYQARGPCIKRRIKDYSVGEGGGCYAGKHCKNGLGCLPVFDSKLKRPNAICVDEAKQCVAGKDVKFAIGNLEYKSLKDKCMGKPKLGVKLGLTENSVCSKTEECQEGLGCKEFTKKSDSSKSNLCAVASTCKVAKTKEFTVKATSVVYVASADGCMKIAPPVAPSLTYPKVTTDGSFGTLCKAAEDCKKNDGKHGCLPGVYKKELYAVCVDNCYIGIGADVTVGEYKAKVRAKQCLPEKPPKDDATKYGQILAGKQCVNSDQCKEGNSCIKVSTSKRQLL